MPTPRDAAYDLAHRIATGRNTNSEAVTGDQLSTSVDDTSIGYHDPMAFGRPADTLTVPRSTEEIMADTAVQTMTAAGPAGSQGMPIDVLTASTWSDEPAKGNLAYGKKTW